MLNLCVVLHENTIRTIDETFINKKAVARYVLFFMKHDKND